MGFYIHPICPRYEFHHEFWILSSYKESLYLHCKCEFYPSHTSYNNRKLRPHHGKQKGFFYDLAL